MKIHDALNTIVQTFQEGNIPASIARSTFPDINVPMNHWSTFNRFAIVIHGSSDARGFLQWKEVGRFPKKGSHAVYILAPRFSKVQKDTEDEDRILSGFIAVPVFLVEDTEGKSLDYELITLPELHLLDVAEAFGVSVKAIPKNDRYYGCYFDRRKEIELASPDEVVFFHELAHFFDYKVRNLQPKPGIKPDREIIAELSACALAYMIGKKLPDSLGNHYTYIEQYAKEANLNVLTSCMKYFSDVENVLQEIVKHSSILTTV